LTIDRNMYDISKVHYQCNPDIFLTSKRFIPEIICSSRRPWQKLHTVLIVVFCHRGTVGAAKLKQIRILPG
jgi:hypothetical protein